ncbi:MAG TPA: phospholipid carrier-dependent glycosyltransferase [Candidatus Sulfotelmatobacter sp.]|jgi:4-amino-4-deoxy-L-arabinose transferase-like glycosyltransferase|nr:phospholipid carrier-dependent glycosyltransferase [Candidatus Sulfotelmatobacter sp.]
MLPLSRIPHAIAVPVLLAIFVVCAIVSVKDDAVTFDETPHLGAGVSALERGDFRLNPEHPPLVKMIAAAPVVALGRGGGDYASEVWRGEPSGGSGGARTGASEWIFGFELLFGSRNSAIRRDPAARIFPARCAMIALGAVLCLLVYGWTREMRGADAGLLALALAVTCPTILAHARLVATDLPEGLGIVATIWAHWRWTRKPTWPRALLTGAALGAALLIKFNGALLAPIVVVLVVAAVAAGRVPARRAAGAIALVAGTAYLSVWAGYGFRYAASTDPGYLLEWSALEKNDPGIPASVRFAATHHLFPEAYLYGFAYAKAWASDRVCFLDGEESIRGWYRYFPEAFLFKTPPAFILLVVWAIAAAALRSRGRGLDGWFVALPALAYSTAAILSRFNIGHRHIAPLYPLLCVAAAPAAVWLTERGRRAWLALGLVAGCVVSFASATPAYLSYFNVLAGGPRGGWRHLVDSNIDWGQDLGRLGAWMRAHGVDEVGLAYFGTADPGAYGVRFRKVALFLDTATDIPAAPPASGSYLAASVTLLQGVYLDRERGFVREAVKRGWVSRPVVTEYLHVCDEARASDRPTPHAASWFVERGAVSEAQRRAIEDALPAFWMDRVRTRLTPVDRVGDSILIYEIP